ncbi:MAG TPA: LLM class flavin-dependent oxidoreductase [Candidatus Dormibacteraeota bacterium]|nr:LLM class flavin-dependent oxidoreductase [Candidatus Dormibacteraeota bacterium]
MNKTFPLTFGLDTFGDLNHEDGKPVSHAQTIRNVVEQGVLAEQVGLDFYGIGEHHTDDFPMPAADVALAAIAARTSRIHVGSAVTVLSSDDPVRVFQRFSTLNALSNGRAEVVLGRGSSVESFPLFGYDLADYEELFEEKTALFAEIMRGGPVTWSGRMRAPLKDQDIVPHLDAPMPVWIGVGGSPNSVIRAARYGFNLMLAIIGGQPSRFAPYSELFRQAQAKFEQAAGPIGVHSPGHIAETDEQARDEFWPAYREIITRLGPSRGFPTPTPEFYEREIGPTGALYVGSPQTVAEKVARNLTILGANRFDLKHGMPGMTQRSLLKSIELFGMQVAPAVRKLLGATVAA